MKVLDLFSGIGGFSLGLERAGMKTMAFCEIDPFCRKVLEKHWPGVPIHDDIRTLDGGRYRGVDVVCGGWPCQTYSSAARGRNNHPDMWHEFFRIINETRPRWFVGENVDRANVDRVFSDLETIGYTGRAHLFRVPFHGHIRSRFWFVADTHGYSESWKPFDEEASGLCAYAGCYWPTDPEALGVDDGVSRRMDRLRALGNAVVPQVAEMIGKAIMRAE